MADYPSTIPQSERSSINPETGMEVTRSVSGRIRGVAYHTVNAVSITVVHPLITDAQKATLESFYTTNKYLPFTFIYNGDNSQYNCLFEQPPTFTYLAPGIWDATANMAGYAV